MYIIIGVVAGIFTGLGMGGGSVLVLLLTLMMKVEQHIAQGANLIYFIPTSISAIIVYFKQKNFNKVVGIKIILPIIIGSAGGAYLTKFIDSQKLKKFFGIFLGIVGMLDIVTTIQKQWKGEHKK